MTIGNRQKEFFFDAISELLLQGGMADVTMSKIAGKAGKSKNLIFHYFPDKETMLREYAYYIVGGQDVSEFDTHDAIMARTDYAAALEDYINDLYYYQTNYDNDEARIYSEIMMLCRVDDNINDYMTQLQYDTVRDFERDLTHFSEHGVLCEGLDIHRMAVELLVEVSGVSLASAVRPMPREYIEEFVAMHKRLMLERLTGLCQPGK